VFEGRRGAVEGRSDILGFVAGRSDILGFVGGRSDILGFVGGRSGAGQGPSGILGVFDGRSGAVEGPSGFVGVRSRSFMRRGGVVPLRFSVLASNMVIVNEIGTWFFVFSCLGKHTSVCSMFSLESNSSLYIPLWFVVALRCFHFRLLGGLLDTRY
jgi:hypothetical protein